ncbi:MarR family winged helix-turn-helix transcriptional regulator [Rheinheimera maricola]|uniref:MarR family transcriptional regulator n=1 Tax=Rheinheimera maricola TaxID=2793282 RepID=A0ABS7XAI3_9GAMM|nr:MarR family transcriptional regulator [Rheinheimera maricola]MBZ9612556.1 MarR family transcriptional regulator [Rheinheimera maricola]
MNKTLPLEEQLCFALYSASNAVVRLYRPLLQPLDLTYPQYIVMLALWQQDNVSLGALGNKTLFDSGTLTPLVKKLEQKGWLKRIASNHDERVKQVVLTAAGKAFETEVLAVMPALRCQISLNNERLVQLRTLARQVQLDIQQLETCGKM